MRTARIKASDAAEKAAESGQTGYLRLAATVENYKRKSKDQNKDKEGFAQLTVLKSFTEILDKFSSAPQTLPAATEAEEKLHSSYQALYKQVGAKGEGQRAMVRVGVRVRVRVAKPYPTLPYSQSTAASPRSASDPTLAYPHPTLTPCPALPCQLTDRFIAFGLVEFHAVVGEDYDVLSHEKVDEVLCEEGGKANAVVKEVREGLKTKNGVVRKAQVVVTKAPPPPLPPPPPPPPVAGEEGGEAAGEVGEGEAGEAGAEAEAEAAEEGGEGEATV